MSVGKSAPAPAGAMFFDCDTPLATHAIDAFVAAGFKGAARYLSRQIGQHPGDLSPSEARLILAGGLAIVPVQHVMAPGWLPTAQLGKTFGDAAAWNASSTGCPPGVNLWLDLEGVSEDAAADDVAAYCEAWFEQVTTGMYLPGLYVGVNCGLDGAALYSRLSVKHYWHAGSRAAPEPSVRGPQILQSIQNRVIAGVGYDSNTIQADTKGGLPLWWTAA